MTTDQRLGSRAGMLDEALRNIDEGRERGVVLRLLGGLGVSVHCRDTDFCERDHGDVDMVGLAKQRGQMQKLFLDFGYTENAERQVESGGRQLQFLRECVHGSTGAPAHEDDHIDVFLDRLSMDHEIDLRTRLDLDDYTVSVTDLLLTKLQVFRLAEKDVRDILTLLKDTPTTTDDRPEAVNVEYIAGLCAAEWGLFYDVCMNLQKCETLLGGYGLDTDDERRVRGNLARLIGAIDAVPKPLRWRMRAKAGTRLQWHNEVEEE